MKKNKKIKILLCRHNNMSETEIKAAELIKRRLEEAGIVVCTELYKIFLVDSAIIFGTAKLRPQSGHLIKLFISKIFRNFIVLESPVIGRETQELTHKEPLFRVGVNGFFADKGFSFAANNMNDATALKLLLGEGYTPVSAVFNHKNRIGIAVQIPGDQSIRGVDQIAGIKEIIRKIRNSENFAEAKIIVRTPPLFAGRKYPGIELIEFEQNVEIQIGTNENKEEFFSSIEFLVTFSSTMGADAIIRGIPACGLDDRSFLRLISASDLSDLLQRKIDLAPNFMNILANTTWRIEDLFSSAFNRVVFSSENVVIPKEQMFKKNISVLWQKLAAKIFALPIVTECKVSDGSKIFHIFGSGDSAKKTEYSVKEGDICYACNQAIKLRPRWNCIFVERVDNSKYGAEQIRLLKEADYDLLICKNNYPYQPFYSLRKLFLLGKFPKQAIIPEYQARADLAADCVMNSLRDTKDYAFVQYASSILTMIVFAVRSGAREIFLHGVDSLAGNKAGGELHYTESLPVPFSQIFLQIKNRLEKSGVKLVVATEAL